ncbi:MAG TPA: hypothetical protein DEO85_06980 [Maritimibacter sp.]|nr:hypothetical protein [Maritimibacter sp.]
MSEHTESVKRVAAYLRDVAEKNAGRPEVADRVNAHAERLDQAVSYIGDLEAKTKALPPELGNIHDLPEELLSELSVAKTDELEDQIVTVINAYGGEASLDQILVGLFRKFSVVQKRRFIQNKLYRMQMVWSVEGKKGVYTTAEPEEDQTLYGDSNPPWDSEIPF